MTFRWWWHCNSLRRGSPRRALVAVMAAVFLFVGFAHNLQHLQGLSSPLASQAEVFAPADAPDAPVKIVLAGEHCHGCTMSAMPVMAPDITAPAATGAPASTAPPRAVARLPAPEFPPPKATV